MKIKAIQIAIALTAMFIVSTLTAQEQQPLKVKEYGIGLSSFNSFSLQYRWGNEKRLFRLNATIGGSTSFGSGNSNLSQGQDTMFSNSNNLTSKTSTPINFNTGLSFSMLKLKQIADKFGLMYGPIVGLSYSIASSQTTQTGTGTSYYYNNPSHSGTYPINNSIKNHSSTLQPYIGFVLGAFYKINASFLLYAEIAPNIYYGYTTRTSNQTNNNQAPYAYNTTNNSTDSNNSFGLANLSNSGATLTIVYRITK
jgi:hypothetical protein